MPTPGLRSTASHPPRGSRPPRSTLVGLCVAHGGPAPGSSLRSWSWSYGQLLLRTLKYHSHNNRTCFAV
jgi:hypothetical protein